MKQLLHYGGFIFCSLVGFLIGHFLLAGAAAAYASVLISYHLYLIFLIVLTEQKKTVSLPIGQTIFTHAAFLMVVIALPWARHYIPFFGIIRLLVPALAPFEIRWLFIQEKPPEKVTKEIARTISTDPRKKSGETYSIDDLINSASAADHEQFLAYMRQPKRTFSSPGRSVREEYGFWLADLAKRKAAIAAAASATSSASGASNATGAASQ